MTLCACGQPSPDAAICRQCEHQLSLALAAAASMARDLDDAVARLMQLGDRGRGGTEIPLVIHLGAMRARDELKNCLTGWVREFADGTWPADDIESIARWLNGRLRTIRLLPQAVAMVDDVQSHVDHARASIDRKPDRMYIGPCPHCGTDLLGNPGDSVITCDGCYREHRVSERQLAMRAAMEDLLGGASWCASVASACGVQLSEFTVRSWARRGRLASHGERLSATGVVVPLYRFGDVLDLAARRAPRLLAQQPCAPHTVGKIAESALVNRGHSHARGEP